MANFCNQCADELKFPNGDLAGLSTPEQTEQKLYCIVLCEGCGTIQVDHLGNCISDDCLKQHGVK